jgi:hypothetical protein
MEQKNIHQGIGAPDVNGNGGAPDDTDRLYQAMSSVIPTFYCPTRRNPKPINRNNGAVDPCSQATTSDVPGNQNNGLIDYACSVGSRSGDNSLGNIDSRNAASIHIACSQVPGPNGQPRGPGNRPTIGLEAVVDGTANVILYGEKRLHVRLLFQNRADDRESYCTGFHQETMRYTDLKPLPDRLDNVTANGANDNGQWRFGASHPASFNVVMCDGAVKSISYKIESADNADFPASNGAVPPVLTGNATLFNRLGIRNDGLPGEVQ